MVVEAKAGARVLPRYARILGVSQGRAQREASEAARACLVAMRFRFPKALYLVELVVRLAEVGAVDLAGTVSQIAKMIGAILGEPPPDPVKLQRALRALEDQTCLVKKESRLRWRLCLAGISDPGSQQHRDLLKETPSPVRLGTTATPGSEDVTAGAGARADAVRLSTTAAPCLEDPDDASVEAVALRQRREERGAARAAQADLEHRPRAARADGERLNGEVERFQSDPDEAEAAAEDRRAIEVVRDELAQQVREHEAALGALRDQLAVRDAELAAERERRRLAEETRTREVAVLEDAVKAQAAAAAAERLHLEEAVLDREIALEDRGRQLEALRAEIERIEATANGQVQAAESAAAEDARKIASLKARLKDERERRRATETRLRHLQVALRGKLVGDDVTDIDLERDRVCLEEIRRVVEEYVQGKVDEREALAREPEHEEDLDQLDEDVRLGRTLGYLLTQGLDEEMARPER